MELNKFKIWRKFWYYIWRMSEITGISLGRAAPWVFAQMTGCSDYKKIKESGN